MSDDITRAWEASFLADLPREAAEELLATCHEEEIFAGQNLYREARDPRFSFLGLVVSGLLRAYLTSPHGRRAVIRYWRPGEVVGVTSVVAGGAPSGVEVVRRGLLLRIDPVAFSRLARTDAAVAWIVARELAQRVVGSAETRIPAVFGSVRVRVAWHLLELSVTAADRTVVRVTQQELADSVGSVREVVARVLLWMTEEQILVREDAGLVVRDRDRLVRIAEGLEE